MKVWRRSASAGVAARRKRTRGLGFGKTAKRTRRRQPLQAVRVLLAAVQARFVPGRKGLNFAGARQINSVAVALAEEGAVPAYIRESYTRTCR